jgi:tetratricopeptide (TPR) repeat protein/DNA-binding CsgD family transcriptional regulator
VKAQASAEGVPHGPVDQAAPDRPVLAPLTQALSPLAMQVRRVTGAVVGRPIELTTIQQELAAARGGRLAGVTVEGEPGIGKTRLLLAASEIATAEGFITVAVAADEEIRGPFLLARSILGSAQGIAAAEGTAAAEALERGLNALSGRDDPGLESMPPDQKLLRTLDLAAIAVRTLAAERPVALLIDDLQWADDDSLRLLRYVVRADATSPIFLMGAIRPEEFALITEAVNLVADMDRLGMVRRLKLNRFTQVESAEFLRQVLGGKVDAADAASMHAQAEGVPFILEELVHAYRDAGMLQEIDGTWTLAKNAERLLPSAVRTLISRRAAHLPDETRAALAEAAVLGRRFSLKDLQALRVQLGEGESSLDALDDAMAPALADGLLVQHPQDSAADYSFSHEQVREFAAASLTPARRRAIHGKIVELLLMGEPAPESLPLLAHHAKAAGDAAVCVRFSIQATRNALQANAPEEVLRVVELALPTASSSQDRLALLTARDEALDMLRRSSERLEGLAELAALAEAMGDVHMEMEVQLRRAAALRLSDEWEQAAELARGIRSRARDASDRRMELAACLELGQALVRVPIGEAYSISHQDVDLDVAEEAYRDASNLAEQLGEEAALAAATRELGVIALARGRAWFVERVMAGEHLEFVTRVAGGEPLQDVLRSLPIAPVMKEAGRLFERSLELYERVGDRRGAMASVIAMAYLSWAPDIHFGSGAGRHIEEIRRLASKMDSMTKESERALAEAQMLYGSHVFSRAKGVPDLAISRGQEAYRQARVIGDRGLEFLAAGGTALAYLDLGDQEEARRWLDRAASVASEAPTPFRARVLESWRGDLDAAAGDADGMCTHLERAAQMATDQGLTAARCEALAHLALAAARLGVEGRNEELLSLAERSANEAIGLTELLRGHAPWGEQAQAALAQVALARGDGEEAVRSAMSVIAALQTALHEDLHLEILIPVAEVLTAAGTQAEQQLVQFFLQMMLALAAQRTLDEEVRVRWFRGPVGRRLVELAGPLDEIAMRAGRSEGDRHVEESDVELLKLLTEGLTNREIAERLGEEETLVARRLGEMFVRIGAPTRSEATAFAFRERVV